MIFSDGVKLSQWNKGQVDICETGFQVKSAEVSFENINNEKLIVVQCEGLSMAYFSPNSTPDDKAPGIEAAKLSQLSTSCWDMTALKSTFQRKKVQKEVMKSQIQVDRVANDIKSFLAQAPVRTPANDEVFYTKHVSDTLLLESEEQKKILHVEGGYRVRKTLHPAQKQI